MKEVFTNAIDCLSEDDKKLPQVCAIWLATHCRGFGLCTVACNVEVVLSVCLGGWANASYCRFILVGFYLIHTM